RKDGETAQPARFERTYRSARNATEVESGKSFSLTASYQQQTFRLQFRRPMENGGLKNLAGHLAPSNHVSGRVVHNSVVSIERDFGFGLLFAIFASPICCAAIEHDRDQAFGFYFCGTRKGKISFHDYVFQYHRQEGNYARGGLLKFAVTGRLSEVVREIDSTISYFRAT